MEQDWITGAALITEAYRLKAERMNWELYVSVYPHFDKKSFIPWAKFNRSKPKKRAQERRTTAQIVSLAERIKKADQKARKT